MNALSEVLHSFSWILYAVSFGFRTVMAAAALCRSRGVAGARATKGPLFVVTLMFLVCLASSWIDKDLMVDTLLLKLPLYFFYELYLSCCQVYMSPNVTGY